MTGAGRWPAIARGSAYLLAAVWLIELARLLHPVPLLSTLGSGGLLAFVLLALLRASPHIRLLFAAISVLAVSLAATLGGIRMLQLGLERAQIFGAFLPSVLLLRSTVESSPRIAEIRSGIGELGAAERQNWTVYGSHLLGAVLNVGAMAILAPLITRSAGDSDRQALAAGSVRGVGTAVMWSPFFLALGFVSHLIPGVRLWEAMGLGLALAAIGLALSHRMFTPELAGRGFVRSLRSIGPLVRPAAMIVATVVAIAVALGIGGLAAVSLAVPVLCGGYLLRRGGSALGGVASRTLHHFGRLADEMIIVVGAIVLGTVIAQVPQVAELARSMTPAVLSGAPLIVALLALLVALGLAGLHPMIGATILLPVLAGGAFGVCDLVLVNTAVFAWGLSATVAIWTLPVAAAATAFAVPVRVLSTGRSLWFAAAYAACGALFLVLTNYWLAC